MMPYADGECGSCDGCGTVTQDVEYVYATGELMGEATTCPVCGGSGRVSEYLYPRPAERRA